MILTSQRLPRLWLILAFSSLAIAGLFSLPPVILRGPAFSHLDVEHIFATALVIHVDLSVLVWFLALASMLWSGIQSRESTWNYVAFIASTFGMVIMIAGAFVPDSQPLKNNYVPMLNNDVFIWGLDVFAVGILLQILLTLFTPQASCKTSGPTVSCPLCFIPVHSFRIITAFFRQSPNEKIPFKTHLEQGAYGAALITLIAYICFLITYLQMPNDFSPHDGLVYYELLFWGGGHVLQFTFVQLLLLGWLWIAHALGLQLAISSRTISFILLLNVLFVIPTPFVYAFHSVGDGMIRMFFTEHMRYVGAISAITLGFFILSTFFKKRKTSDVECCSINPNIIYAGLIFSMILFFVGGVIALLISGTNAQIPAHYHGSIIGITTIFMALIYLLLPSFKFGTPPAKASFYQIICYGLGQLFHIIGLAWMGGYGALRKAPNSLDTVDHTLSKILFFSGGSLAIIGGLTFVVIVLRCFIVRR